MSTFLLAHRYRAFGPMTFTSPSGGTVDLRFTGRENLQNAALSVSTRQKEFLTIHFDRLDSMNEFAQFALQTEWRDQILLVNPIFEREQRMAKAWRPRGERHHLRVKLVPICGVDLAALEGGLLFVPDLHQGDQSDLLMATLRRYAFSWVGLEENRDIRPELNVDQTLDMKTPKGAEILRLVKALKLPYVLMDYQSPYFYFPVTDTSFNDFNMAVRNKLWVDSLPARWTGVGVVFGGQAHVMQTPSFDFQDFYAERFPNRPLLVLDLESKCE